MSPAADRPALTVPDCSALPTPATVVGRYTLPSAPRYPKSSVTRANAPSCTSIFTCATSSSVAAPELDDDVGSGRGVIVTVICESYVASEVSLPTPIVAPESWGYAATVGLRTPPVARALPGGTGAEPATDTLAGAPLPAAGAAKPWLDAQEAAAGSTPIATAASAIKHLREATPTPQSVLVRIRRVGSFDMLRVSQPRS